MSDLKAVIFDLDGVITKTATVHAAAWKSMFDEYLKSYADKKKEPFRAFTEKDYLEYVDGKPRDKGIESFLDSRHIKIPPGQENDSPDKETIGGLGNRKNIKFQEVLEKEGVEVFKTTVDLIKDLKAKKIHIGIASSSKNCQSILKKIGLEKLFETRVDGVVSQKLGLKGKPEGDIFIKAAENIGAHPSESAVVEDAVSGVQAGRKGGFGLVIGVARQKNENELKANGADVVVTDFKDIKAEDVIQWFRKKSNS